MAKNKDKLELLSVLNQLNLAFHTGIFNLAEKKLVLNAIDTGHLSEELETILAKKKQEFPCSDILAKISGFLERGE